MKCEVADGFGCSILITCSSQEYLGKIAIEFQSGSALPWGGAEYGIQSFVPKEKTPDYNFGFIGSI